MVLNTIVPIFDQRRFEELILLRRDAVGEVDVVNVTVPVAIDGQKVTIVVNGESKEVTVSGGKASAEFSGLANGTYEVVVS